MPCFALRPCTAHLQGFSCCLGIWVRVARRTARALPSGRVFPLCAHAAPTLSSGPAPRGVGPCRKASRGAALQPSMMDLSLSLLGHGTARPDSSTSHHWTCRTISSSMWYLGAEKTARRGPSSAVRNCNFPRHATGVLALVTRDVSARSACVCVSLRVCVSLCMDVYRYREGNLIDS